jgi:ribosomal protein L7/L12
MEWLILAGFVPLAIFAYAEVISRIRRLEKKLDALLMHQGIDAAKQNYAISDRVKQLLEAEPPRKLDALKVYRQETGESLRESKEAIESFIKKM